MCHQPLPRPLHLRYMEVENDAGPGTGASLARK